VGKWRNWGSKTVKVTQLAGGSSNDSPVTQRNTMSPWCMERWRYDSQAKATPSPRATTTKIEEKMAGQFSMPNSGLSRVTVVTAGLPRASPVRPVRAT
jgi:hypothetical protein